MRSIAFVAIVLSARIGVSFADAIEGTEADFPGYATRVKPFFKTHCVRCHGAETQEGDDLS